MVVARRKASDSFCMRLGYRADQVDNRGRLLDASAARSSNKVDGEIKPLKCGEVEGQWEMEMVEASSVERAGGLREGVLRCQLAMRVRGPDCAGGRERWVWVVRVNEARGAG